MASIAPQIGLSERLRDWREGFVLTERMKRVGAILALLAFGGLWGAAVGLGGPATAIVVLRKVRRILSLLRRRAGTEPLP